MADAAHGASGAHPFFRVLKGFMDEPGEGFSLAGAVRMAEEFAFLGGKDKPARPRREPEDGLHARFSEFGQPVSAPPEPETSVEAIRRELKIRPSHPIDELRRIRKRFALQNHPDRSPSAIRPAAEQRMKIANSIIDSEIEFRRRAIRGGGQ